MRCLGHCESTIGNLFSIVASTFRNLVPIVASMRVYVMTESACSADFDLVAGATELEQGRAEHLSQENSTVINHDLLVNR